MKKNIAPIFKWIGSSPICKCALLALSFGGNTIIYAQTSVNLSINAPGMPITANTPNGSGGNPDITVIMNSEKPPLNSDDSWKQYDTFNGNDLNSIDEYIGYTFSQPYTFTQLVFQEGKHFDNGGYFEGNIRIEVQNSNGGAWTEVSSTLDRDYGGKDNEFYEIYTFTLPASPVGTGIRIRGDAGGTAHFISVGELEAWGFGAPPVSGVNGLKGEYFNNINVSGAPVLTRTDATVNFNWGSGSPDPQINANNFSVRWTGQVQAPVTGDYTFYTQSNDGARLWVNGTQIITQAWIAQNGSTTYSSTPVSLVGGQKYDIRLEYYESTLTALAILKWSYPGQAQTVIPTSRLFIGGGTNPGDSQAPSVPTNLSVSNVGQTSLTLSWTSSTDNVGGSGVSGYEVFRNSVSIGTTSTNSFPVPQLTCNTTYNFSVRARDVAGNPSPQSTPVPFKTSACANNNFLDITAFRAIPNDGLSDQQAILDCIKEAKRLGKTVFIPEGVFTHDGLIQLDGVSMTGANRNTSILLATQPLNCAIYVTGNNVKLSNFKHDYTTVLGRSEGGLVSNNISFDHASNFIIDNVFASKSTGAGIFNFGGRNGVIKNCRVEGTNADAIHNTFGAFNITVSGNVVRSPKDDMIAVVTYWDEEYCHDILITGNDCSGNTWGRGITVVGGHHVTIESNTIANSVGAGILIATEGNPGNKQSTRNVTDVIINSNTINNCGADIDGSPRIGGHTGILLSGISTRDPADRNVNNVRITNTTSQNNPQGNYRSEGDVTNTFRSGNTGF